MAVYYVESSALLKRYKSEKGSDVVEELFNRKTDTDVFVISHLTVFEVNSVAARLLKGKVIRPRQYERMVGTFIQDISTFGVVVLPLHHTLLQDAIDLLPDFPLRAADALQFATAHRVSRVVGDQPFRIVNSNRNVEEACKGHSIPCLNPESDDGLDQLRELRAEPR